MDEIFICKDKLGFDRSDVMAMPTYERRYYLGLLSRKNEMREEQIEKMKEQQQTQQGAKGSRKTTVGGNKLKQRLKSGDIPHS